MLLLYSSTNICKAICFSFLLKEIKFNKQNDSVRNISSELTLRMIELSFLKGKIAFLSTQFCKKICYFFLGAWRNLSLEELNCKFVPVNIRWNFHWTCHVKRRYTFHYQFKYSSSNCWYSFPTIQKQPTDIFYDKRCS